MRCFIKSGFAVVGNNKHILSLTNGKFLMNMNVKVNIIGSTAALCSLFLPPYSTVAQDNQYDEMLAEIANAFGESRPSTTLEIVSKVKR